MDDKKIISIIEDLIFEDISKEDYRKAVDEAKDLIKKVKAKQLILHVVVKSFVCPNGCGRNGDMGSCIECVGK
jgi:hypothetical protein